MLLQYFQIFGACPEGDGNIHRYDLLKLYPPIHRLREHFHQNCFILQKWIELDLLLKEGIKHFLRQNR